MANETPLTLVGNLTADPELRFTPNGVAVAKFTIASTPRVFDKTAGEYKDGEALFMTCTVWRDLAEHVAESLSKGARVVATGTLSLSRWETPEGEKRQAYGMTVEDIGPSLRWATAKVQRMQRSNSSNPADPWSTATTSQPTSDTPPF